MFIKIKTLEGTELQLEVDKKMNVGELKKMISESESISVAQQRLIYAGKQLLDSSTLESCSIKSDDVLHMVLALRGG